MSRTIQSLPQTPANKIYCIIIATNGIPEEDYDISLWKSLKSNNIQSCISVLKIQVLVPCAIQTSQTIMMISQFSHISIVALLYWSSFFFRFLIVLYSFCPKHFLVSSKLFGKFRQGYDYLCSSAISKYIKRYVDTKIINGWSAKKDLYVDSSNITLHSVPKFGVC